MKRPHTGPLSGSARKWILLEAETDNMWHVFDAFLEAVHKLETGRGFTSTLDI